MSDIVTAAIAALSAKLTGSGFDRVAMFEIDDEGSLIIDQDGVREGGGEADVTLSADAGTFREILDGDLNPTAAFMSGRLRISGDMGAAMKLGGLLA